MNRIESLGGFFPSLRLLNTLKNEGRRANGGIDRWRNRGRGPLGAFAPKTSKLNTKSPPQGEGGLNLWDLGARYRMGLTHRFFLVAGGLIIFPEIKEFKRCRCDCAKQSGVWRVPIAHLFFWDCRGGKRETKMCREIQGGGGSWKPAVR